MLTGQPGLAVADPFSITLAKPIDAGQLLREVRRAIDQRKAAWK
jgi:hypothetical protein